ncbi:flagellar protein FlgN [Pseudidiomarina marina]|uniref:Flagellar protein FlgN n=1 Tax=Pseudidiomarina marina TaxID=502366 RepID=A0A432YGM5_9GAMM|nr:flagellar protein FlgN [Pseudidiomarina marina]RUO60098.1 flagellar protein FlgN [Pseudidiomarina marina]
MSLRQHLTEQVERLGQLQALLEQEQRLLGDGKIDGEKLKSLAEQKHVIQQNIESSESKRRAAQQKLGFSNDAAGARKAAEQASCTDIWQQLLERTQRIAQLNSLNGELIQHRLHHNQQMLNILRDAAGSGSAAMYGADGSQESTPQRLNSKA